MQAQKEARHWSRGVGASLSLALLLACLSTESCDCNPVETEKAPTSSPTFRMRLPLERRATDILSALLAFSKLDMKGVKNAGEPSDTESVDMFHARFPSWMSLTWGIQSWYTRFTYMRNRTQRAIIRGKWLPFGLTVKLF